MSSIVAVNGSPKSKDSASSMFIKQIESMIGSEISVYQAVQLIRQKDISPMLADILKAEALLFVFPLYVDSLPAPLIKALTLLESAAKSAGHPLPKVYAVCNCGFFEAEQNFLALDMMKNFCERAGLSWSFGIGVGGGGMVSAMSKNMAEGPAANVHAALRRLGDAISCGNLSSQNIFVTPKFPRALYQFGGNMGWRRMARANKVGKKLNAKPHIDPNA